MENQILVPLRTPHQIQQVLPYVDEIARPGTRVLFLVPSELKPIHVLTEQLLLIQTGINYSLSPGNDQHAIAQQRASLAKAKVFSACEPLAKKGIEIDMTIYKGSLRRTLREHLRRESVQLVIMSPVRRNWALSLLHVMRPLSRFFALPSCPPVLVLHLGAAAERHDNAAG